MSLFNNPYMPNTSPYVFNTPQPITTGTPLPSTLPHYEIPIVYGMNGAQEFPMGPNSKALLVDDLVQDGIVLYMVSTDSAGHKNIITIDGMIRQNDTPATIEDKLGERLASIEQGLTDLKEQFKQFEEMMK